MSSTTAANITARAILNFCAARGVAPEDVLSAAGIPEKLIEDPGGRIPVQRMFALWEEAQKLTDDGLITSHIVEFLPFGSYKIMDYLVAAVSTPREGMEKLIRKYRLTNGAF